MWKRIGRQLQNPQGLGGRLTGRFMRVVNRAPNRLAVDALDLGAGDTALDLGCGPGHAIVLMAAQAATVHGIDQSATMIEQAGHANRAAVLEGRVVLKNGSFNRLPYPDASFDKILASNVMYFWANIPKVLGEVQRVLKPGGRLAIYVTDAQTMKNWKFASPETHRLFTSDEVRMLLVKGGFDENAVSIEQINLPGGVRGLLAIADLVAQS